MRITVTQKQTGFSFSSFMFLILLAMAMVYSWTAARSAMLWFGLGACAISLVGFLYSLWRKEVLLQIDDSGIYDKRLGMGKILWVDLEDVQLQVTEENRFLCFRVHNPEPYLNRLKGANRERVLFQRQLGFRGFNVDIGPLDVNLLELKKHIDQRIGKRL